METGDGKGIVQLFDALRKRDTASCAGSSSVCSLLATFWLRDSDRSISSSTAMLRPLVRWSMLMRIG